MYKPNRAPRAIIPMPVGLTQDTMDNIVVAYSAHFAKAIELNTVLTNRTAVYATVINATNNQGASLEQQVGSENAKAMTEVILGNLTSSISKVPIDGLAVEAPTYNKPQQ